MAYKLFLIAALAIAVNAQHHHQAEHEEYHDHPKYEFAYEVKDEHTGDYHSQHETRDGEITKGFYSLIDADGYKRTVEYSVDGKSGFNAIVHREPTGHAPAPPAHKHQAPQHHAPQYHVAATHQAPQVHHVPQMHHVAQMQHVVPVHQAPQMHHVAPVHQVPQMHHVAPVHQMTQMQHVAPVHQMAQMHHVPQMHTVVQMNQAPQVKQAAPIHPKFDVPKFMAQQKYIAPKH